MSLPVIVSAASPEYFRCLVQLALSVERTQPRSALRLVAYDLGFAPRQRHDFERRFTHWELRTFDFDRHPPHVAVRDRLVNTNAWKPVIVREVLSENDAPLLWLDSATVVLEPLTPVFAHIERTGLYTPYGGAGSLEELTHPATLAALGVPPHVARERQRASGVFGANPRSPAARELVNAWADACLDEKIAIPPGADHRAHRFDQSVLNALLYPLAAREGIALTSDEIDVSSAHPTPLYRTRNKVKNWVPVAADPLARAWFAAYRAIDVALIRWSSRSRSTTPGTAAR
jgi:hypothetical protein